MGNPGSCVFEVILLSGTKIDFTLKPQRFHEKVLIINASWFQLRLSDPCFLFAVFSS